MKVLALLTALTVFILTTACGSTASNLVIALNAVSDAASVAVIVTQGLVATGAVDQATASDVASYATSVSTAVNASITELDSTDTNAQKIDIIAADFVQVATPAFGSSSTQVSAAIQAVSSAIQIFLGDLKSGTLLTLAKANPTVPPSLALSRADQSMLKTIHKETAETLVSAAKLRK